MLDFSLYLCYVGHVTNINSLKRLIALTSAVAMNQLIFVPFIARWPCTVNKVNSHHIIFTFNYQRQNLGQIHFYSLKFPKPKPILYISAFNALSLA